MEDSARVEEERMGKVVEVMAVAAMAAAVAMVTGTAAASRLARHCSRSQHSDSCYCKAEAHERHTRDWLAHMSSRPLGHPSSGQQRILRRRLNQRTDGKLRSSHSTVRRLAGHVRA